MPHNGIKWTQHLIPAAVKILATRREEERLLTEGVSRNDILNNGSSILPRGFRGEKRFEETYEYIEHRMPYFFDYLEEHQLKNYDCPPRRIIQDRVHATLVNDELRRFREEPEWRLFYSLLDQELDSQKPIPLERLYAVQAELVKKIVRGKSGVYVLTHPGLSQEFYLGEGADVARRYENGHNNSPFFLVRTYVTDNKKVAQALESSLFHSLEKEKLIVGSKISNGRIGSKGALVMESGVKPLPMIDYLVDTYYKAFCKAKAGIKGL